MRPVVKVFGSRANLRRALSAHRIGTIMGALGIVFILFAAGYIAWRERAADLREANYHARDNAFFLADHAGRLFEVADIALRATAAAVGDDDDWDTIGRSSRLYDEMRSTNAVLPFIDDLWLNDEAGLLRLSTFAFPAPRSNASDRDIFKAVRGGARELVIGDPIVGRVTTKPTFLVARRLDRRDGTLRGMVSATADISYFLDYWHRLDVPDGEHLALVREGSGATLVRFPVPPGVAPVGPEPTDERSAPAALKAVAAFQAATAFHPAAGQFLAGPRRPAFYHRIGALPLFMVVSFDEHTVMRAWRAWLWWFVPFPTAALLAVFAIMALNDRQSRTEARARRDIERAQADLASANQRLEERVAERTADLKASNEEIQRFAYVVSHDLRAPLVNIMGFTSELGKLRQDLFAPDQGHAGARSPDPAALRADFDEALGFIRSSIDKMNRLINAILLLSRGGQRRFQPEPIDMSALLRSVAEGVAHRVQTAGARIAIGDLPAITTDRIAVEQVFSNLIDNAVKYLRPDVPGFIAITGTVSRDKVAITVRDNGRGIAAKDWNRVFDLFRRSGPQDQPGEGIGLAHVRLLLRRLGGSVDLDSKLGEGSGFTVTLPLSYKDERI